MIWNNWARSAANAHLIREAVARNVLFERHRAELTQEALASIIGVGRDTIARLEAAKQEAQLLTLFPLGYTLHVPLIAILAGLPGVTEWQGPHDRGRL
jgi:DNA-binding XRE family transcriptional regulator